MIYRGVDRILFAGQQGQVAPERYLVVTCGRAGLYGGRIGDREGLVERLADQRMEQTGVDVRLLEQVCGPGEEVVGEVAGKNRGHVDAVAQGAVGGDDPFRKGGSCRLNALPGHLVGGLDEQGKRPEIDRASGREGLQGVEDAPVAGRAAEGVEAQTAGRMGHDGGVGRCQPGGEFADGAVIAQLGYPDMREPIAFALGFPERLTTGGRKLDFATVGSLSFEAPDFRRFPCLELAYEALRRGGNAPCALNAANEMAVAAYLKDLISFYDIARINERCLAGLNFVAEPTLDDIFETNREIAAIADGYID